MLHLRNAMDLTNNFIDANKIQNKQLYNIFEKLVTKYQSTVFGYEV